MSKLYASISGVNNILSVDISTSHTASTATSQVICSSTSKNIGDSISIDLGYTDNHSIIFTGYVKSIDKETPKNITKLTCSDVFIRAIDYFVVSADPDDPFTRKNIGAAILIKQVLALAGLTSFTYTDPQFTFATTPNSEVVVSLVSAYDFCKMVADLLAWNLWADSGTIYFRNRKPYVMDGNSGQVGDIADTVLKTIWTKDMLNFEYRESDRELRNRVVLHGAPGVYSESQSSTSYVPRTDSMEQILPSGFYKSMALVTEIIDNQSMADNACDYNLDLYNRVTTQASTTVIGDPDLLARRVIHVNEKNLGINSDWYIYTADHSWSQAGYTTNMELRR